MKTFEEVKEIFLSQPWGQGINGEICYYIGKLEYPAYSKLVNVSIADRLTNACDAEFEIGESGAKSMFDELKTFDWNADEHEARNTARRWLESFDIDYERASDFIDDWCIYGITPDLWEDAANEEDEDFLKIVQRAFEEQDGEGNE